MQDLHARFSTQCNDSVPHFWKRQKGSHYGRHALWDFQLFDGNTISGNEGYGIWLQDDVKGTFQSNIVEGNKMAGLSVNHMAAPNVQYNTIKDGQQVGLVVHCCWLHWPVSPPASKHIATT